MTANVTDLDKALLGAVLLADLGLPIAQENASFEKPADGAPWMSVTLAHELPQVAGSHMRHSGTIEVVLFYPRLTGTAAVSAMSQRLASFFRAGRVVAHLDTLAMVTSCGAPRDGEKDGYFARAIDISWTARIPRRT